LPDFTRVDAAVFYAINPKLNLQLNIENLFDADYYSSAHSNNNIMPGAPRAFRLGLNVTF
jgi:catecholate siderophore receptor